MMLTAALLLKILLFVCAAIAGSIITRIALRVVRARREWMRLRRQHHDESQGA